MKKKNPCVGVELSAGGDPHGSEKPRWSADNTRCHLDLKKMIDLKKMLRSLIIIIIIIIKKKFIIMQKKFSSSKYKEKFLF